MQVAIHDVGLRAVIRAYSTLAAALALGLVTRADFAHADAFAVRRTEGLVHGFLVLRDLDGTRLASGDAIDEFRRQPSY